MKKAREGEDKYTSKCFIGRVAAIGGSLSGVWVMTCVGRASRSAAGAMWVKTAGPEA